MLNTQFLPHHIVGDTHFYESRAVKVILDYLRTAYDKSDPALWGPLINCPKRFVPNMVVREVWQGWQGWQKEFCLIKSFLGKALELSRFIKVLLYARVARRVPDGQQNLWYNRPHSR